MKIQSINPHTLSVEAEYPIWTSKEVDAAIQKANTCYQSYKFSSFEERTRILNKAAKLLKQRRETLARIITDEMGKVYREACGEIDKCQWVCEYYADHGRELLQDKMINTEGSKSYVSYQSLGALLAVMPWNFPFWQVFRFAAPALMAGNVGLLKHASNVPRCALAIEEIFRDAGVPEGGFTSLLIGSDRVASIIADPRIVAVTLTGSGAAGSAVAQQAGKYLKKAVLELGGSDPYLVLHDADLSLAVEHILASRMLNAGQSCIGAKRVIVVEEVYESLVSRLKEAMEKVTFGDPMSAVDMGPLARLDLRNEVHHQVKTCEEQGAKLVIGGYIPELKGAYYPPTLITDVEPNSPAHDDEIFGPVVSVLKARDEEDAIRIANDSRFGLGACVFTEDTQRGEEIAMRRLDAGTCFVNQFVKSDPRLPFGGIKQSGFGRELSELGIKEFVNAKTIYVK